MAFTKTRSADLASFAPPAVTQSAEAADHRGSERAARLDRLISTRLSKLILPPDLEAKFKAQSFRASQKMMASWCHWIAAVNLACGAFDLGELSGHPLVLAIEVRFIISLMFVLAGQFTRRNALRRNTHLLIIVPCVITVLLGNIAALLSHSNELFILYMSMSAVVVYTAIMFLQIDLRPAMIMAIISLAQLAGFVALSSLESISEKIQLMIFLSGVMGALLNARRIQNLYHYRVFLLQMRDEVRSHEVTALNQQLSGIAYTDRLTDIPNRRFFDEKMEALRTDPQAHLPLVLCLIDLDHFKKLNDTLGHQQGDRCLQMVATTLRDHLRAKTDMLARYGGEEFVVILPETDFVTAMQLVERLRLAIRALHHPNPDTPSGYVTISAGIAVAEGGGFDPEALLAQADRALYRAKTAGRDQICA
jgi:diguanylate cyclase (GGDEF)-like protein